MGRLEKIKKMADDLENEDKPEEVNETTTPTKNCSETPDEFDDFVGNL